MATDRSIINDIRNDVALDRIGDALYKLVELVTPNNNIGLDIRNRVIILSSDYNILKQAPKPIFEEKSRIREYILRILSEIETTLTINQEETITIDNLGSAFYFLELSVTGKGIVDIFSDRVEAFRERLGMLKENSPGDDLEIKKLYQEIADLIGVINEPLKENTTPVSVIFDLQEFSKEDIAETLAWLSDIYEEVGGDELVISDMNVLDGISKLEEV